MMGPDDVIIAPKIATGSGGDRFLADIAMRRAFDMTSLEQLCHTLVKASDADHGCEESFQEVFVYGHRPLLKSVEKWTFWAKPPEDEGIGAEMASLS
jgi:hypothetical protein